MNVHLADVQVCIPGRGCVFYVPGAGQALNAVVAIGPRVLDGSLAVVLIALVLVVVVAIVRTVGPAVTRGRGVRPHGLVVIAAALLVAGGVVAAVRVLAPAVTPVAQVLQLVVLSCTGLALVVLADPVPRVGRVPLIVAGVLLLLSLPISVGQFLLAAPLGPFPSEAVTVLGHLMLAVAGVVLLVTRSGSGTRWWGLLLPPVVNLLSGVRLGLPLPVGGWVDLLPAVALLATGLLLLASRSDPGPRVRARPRVGAQLGGTAVALSVTLTVLLAWPTSSPGAPGAGEPPIRPVQVVTASAPLRFPLDGYLQSTADRNVVLLAENTLIRACAARREVAVQAADLLPSEKSDRSFSLLGLIDEQQAESIGYWTPPAPESSGGAQSTRDLSVLAGCVRTARARLGDDGRAQELVREAAFDALAWTDSDSRVRHVQVAWSRCMQLRGFAYPSPQEVALTQAMAFPTPSDTRTASASVSCEHGTDLPGLRAAVLTAYEKRAIADRGTRLTIARSTLTGQKRTATAILRGRSAQ